MQSTRMPIRLCVALALALALAPTLACERRDGQNAESGAPAAQAPHANSAGNRNGNANTPDLRAATAEEAPALGADVSTWEGRRTGRITFVPSPEPADFPTGAFRAATKLCLEETRASVEATIELKLTTKGGHVRTVNATSDAADAGVPPSLTACLQRLYAKIPIANAPEKLSASVRVAAPTD